MCPASLWRLISGRMMALRACLSLLIPAALQAGIAAGSKQFTAFAALATSWNERRHFAPTISRRLADSLIGSGGTTRSCSTLRARRPKVHCFLLFGQRVSSQTQITLAWEQPE